VNSSPWTPETEVILDEAMTGAYPRKPVDAALASLCLYIHVPTFCLRSTTPGRDPISRALPPCNIPATVEAGPLDEGHGSDPGPDRCAQREQEREKELELEHELEQEQKPEQAWYNDPCSTPGLGRWRPRFCSAVLPVHTAESELPALWHV
jgi:hypothetical protein